jgi:3-dehydroquinate dehydratase
MSIAILAAPDGARRGTHGLPREVVSQLVERASLAGKTVAVCSCRDMSDILDRLRRIDGRNTEFLLFDPGAASYLNGELDAALHRAGVPYIEVHADGTGSPQQGCVGTPLNVIDGYGAQGYVLALSIALERLGCSECENNIHVGT